MRDDLHHVMTTHHDSRQDDRIRKPRRRLTKDEVIRAVEEDDYENSPKPFRADSWNRERHTYPNTRVLQNWLKKHVGQPWDAVFAELSQVPPMGGYTIHEVLEHLVEQHPQFINGVAYDSAGRWPLEGRYWSSFYVDAHGMMQMAPAQKNTYRRKTDPNVVVLDPMHEFVRMNGLWFDVHYEPNPRPDYLGRWANWDDRRIVQKKTLNAKELKQHGLSNTTASGRIES